MRVEQVGEGEPEIAVVGGIHGDEPCGVRAVERLLEERPAVERPVKLVIANEPAIEREQRYTDTDLNRAFPGNPDSEAYEDRLAAELLTELRGCTTLSMHSTQSYDGPFAIVNDEHALIEAVGSRLSIDAVVQVGPTSEGRLIAHARTIEVECGHQGTPAATENATRIVEEFLAATGVLPAIETPDQAGVPVFRFERAIPKPDAETYATLVENFERVAAGEAFATADGESLIAEEPFYPVLLSAYGYQDIFGYTAELVGRSGASGRSEEPRVTETASTRTAESGDRSAVESSERESVESNERGSVDAGEQRGDD